MASISNREGSSQGQRVMGLVVFGTLLGGGGCSSSRGACRTVVGRTAVRRSRTS